MRKSFAAAAAAFIAVGVTCALPVLAQPAGTFAKPDDAVKYRKAAFTMLSTHFGRVAAMANGRAPFDAKSAADNAELAQTLSKLPFTAFGPGTDTGNSNARPEVWSKPDEFRAAQTKMIDEVAKLNAAAKTGSLDAIKTAAGAVGQSCKACHDNFRKE